MPAFKTRRFEQILSSSVARVVSRSRMADVSPSGVTMHILGAHAREDDEQYHQASNLLSLFDIKQCFGDDLDDRAADFPVIIRRVGATRAAGEVVFSRAGTSGTVVVRAGTRVRTASNVVFRTTATAVINPTSSEQVEGHGVGRDSNPVSVEAEVLGSSGVVAATTISEFVQRVAGVDEVTNLQKTLPGYDRESDDDFKRRLLNYLKSLARCPPLAIEAAVVGTVDPVTQATVRYAKIVEDPVVNGHGVLYVDDGSGQAEAIADSAVALEQVLTWNGTTTVTTPTTAGVEVNDWIRLDADGQLFRVTVVTTDVSYTIANPGSDTIPTGATASSVVSDILTEGLGPGDVAVGGETVLFTDNAPLRLDLPFVLATSVQGNVPDDEYTVNPATGQINLDLALEAGERVAVTYTYNTGFLAHVQRVVNGDREDRETYPGLRPFGSQCLVRVPSVLIQDVEAIITTAEGYDHDEVTAGALQAIIDHINSLPISGDVLRADLIAAIKAVPGVKNVQLVTPAQDVITLDDQLARTTEANIEVV